MYTRIKINLSFYFIDSAKLLSVTNFGKVHLKLRKGCQVASYELDTPVSCKGVFATQKYLYMYNLVEYEDMRILYILYSVIYEDRVYRATL